MTQTGTLASYLATYKEPTFTPGVRVQAYRDGRPYAQGTVIESLPDEWIRVQLDCDRPSDGGTRIWARCLTIVH